MRKLLALLLYGTYCIALFIFTQQEEQFGESDTRYLLVAMGTVPLWGFPLARGIYRKLSRRRTR